MRFFRVPASATQLTATPLQSWLLCIKIRSTGLSRRFMDDVPASALT